MPAIPTERGRGNVFAAVQNLETALTNNDTAGITAAVTSLQSASSYLNNQLAFYGEVENRVQEATDLAQKFQTQQTTELGNLRDTDVPPRPPNSQNSRPRRRHPCPRRPACSR